LTFLGGVVVTQRLLWPSTIIATLVAAAFILGSAPGTGRSLSLSLAFGGALGVVLQRARFCFLCHARDFIDRRDPRGLLSILLALAVGTVGYHVFMSGWLAAPNPPRLPPDAHIGPVSWALALAGLVFGLGMAISGSCVSAHIYRLGEGSAASPFALLGAGAGFLLGFITWNPLYSLTVAEAPVIWLPHYVGYAGSLALQLAALAGLAAALWRYYPTAVAGEPPRPPLPAGLFALVGRWFEGRWPYWVGGLAVGVISFLVLARLKPLGVTSALGGAARALGADLGLTPLRLNGLDGFAGCATVPGASWFTPNAALVIGLAAGAFAAAAAARQFKPRLPTVGDIVRGLSGGVLLGWGAMTGLGCTVGVVLSGTMAGAASGWVFAACAFAGVWAGLRAPQFFTLKNAVGAENK
jgi:uncharacterized protein